jgi:hypothetical protein
MAQPPEQPVPGRRAVVIKEYVIGLGVAICSALYGAYALMVGQSYLPGVRGGTTTVGGTHGRGVALAYLVGGVFLFLRFFLEKRCHREFTRNQIYLVENMLLIVLIGTLIYVLLNVGTAG